MIARDLALRLLLTLAAAGVASALLFTLFPQIDLWVSGQFADQTGFAANQNTALQLFREIIWNLSLLICLFAAIMWGLTALRRPADQRIGSHVWGFVVLTYVLAPGVMANVILKDNWGRARPRSVTEFGGTMEFTPALEITDQCSRNCSFVSGEAAGAVATALVLSLLFAPAMRASGRWSLMVPVWSAALVASSLRIAMGGHFLSDVIFAALFTAVIALMLVLLLRIDREPASVTLGNIWRDLCDVLTFGAASRKP